MQEEEEREAAMETIFIPSNSEGRFLLTGHAPVGDFTFYMCAQIIFLQWFNATEYI